MSPIDAIQRMMDESGVSASDLSRRIGKSRTYISSTMAHGSTPKVDTLARIAHECGYRMYLERTGRDIIELYSEDDSSKAIDKVLSELPDTVEVDEIVKAMNKWLAENRKLYRADEREAEQAAFSAKINAGKNVKITKDGATVMKSETVYPEDNPAKPTDSKPL